MEIYDKLMLVKHVIAQVVGWENTNPITETSATTWESYTQCHLDVGPTLSRVTRSLLGGDPGDPRGNEM